MSITVVFDPPLPSDNPETFNQKAFTLLGDLNTWSGQANQVAGDINADKTALLNAGLSTVSGSIANVNAVGTNIAAVATVAADLNEPVSEIETVAASIANVDAVGGSIGNVNTVATNIASVNTAATNIVAIQNAATNASNAAASAAAAATSASQAAASATSAVNAPGTSGTSTSSLTVGLGNQTFTTQTGKAWVVGQPVIIARTSAPSTTWMYGVISSYNSSTGAMTVAVSLVAGSGTFTDWTIGLSGPLTGVDSTDIGTAPNQIPLNGYLGTLAYQDRDGVNIGGGVVTAQIRRRAPVTKTADFTVADTEHWLICNGTGTITVTLPDAGTNVGREIMLKTIAAQSVVSASSNVVPLNGGVAGTAILPAAAGKYATLVSDGTNWVIMQAN